MALSVGGNFGELVGLRMLAQHQAAQSRAMERLATGQRINRGADDPSGLIAATHLGAQAAGIQKNIQRMELESYSLGAKDGALSVIEDMLMELESSVVGAANEAGISDGERESLGIEADSVIDGIAFILSTSKFNGQAVFKDNSVGGLGGIWYTPRAADAAEAPEGKEDDGDGARPGLAGDGASVEITGTPASAPSKPKWLTLDALRNGGVANLIDGDLSVAQDLITTIRRGVTENRAGIGAQLKNFYDPQIRSLQRELEGTLDSKSKIQDADFAVEVSELVRSQVLGQAAMFVIQKSREIAAQGVLSLLG